MLLAKGERAQLAKFVKLYWQCSMIVVDIGMRLWLTDGILYHGRIVHVGRVVVLRLYLRGNIHIIHRRLRPSAIDNTIGHTIGYTIGHAIGNTLGNTIGMVSAIVQHM